MNLQFNSQTLEITPALREIASTKLGRLAKHLDGRADMQVTFQQEKLNQIAEAHLHLPGTILNARAESHDLYEAIDKLVDKLDSQIIKHKEKLRDHRE